MTQSTYAQRREAVLAAALDLGRFHYGETLATQGANAAAAKQEKLWKAFRGAVRSHDSIAPDAIVDSDGAHVVGSPETSRRAAKALFPKSGSVRRKVLDDIWNRRDGLATDEMIERSLGGKHQTVSSARNWLMNAGWVVDSRLRTADKKAVLWQLTAAAKAHIREELQP